MMKYFFYFLSVMLMGSVNAVAQADAEKAKAYYFSAEEQFNSGKYTKAIEYCEQAEALLGSSNALLEALKVKSHFQQGNIEKAKQSLDAFFSFKADENLAKQLAPYVVKIEDAERLRVKKFQEEQAARIKKEKAAEAARIRKEQEELATIKKRLADAEFSEGIGLISEGAKMGYIDAKGKLIIPLIYDDATPFENGRARVQKNKLQGVIGRTGEEIVPIRYSSLSRSFDANGYMAFTKKVPNNSTWPWEAGFLDQKANIVTVINTKEEAPDLDYVYYWCAHWKVKSNKNCSIAQDLFASVSTESKYYLDARVALAELYYSGNCNTELNYAKAFEYYSAAAATMRLSQVQYERLGDMYYNGVGTSVNKNLALLYYEKYLEHSEYLVSNKSIKYITTAADLGKFTEAKMRLKRISKLNRFARKLYSDKLYYAEGYIAELQNNRAAAKKAYNKAAKNAHREYGRIAKQRLEDMSK